MIYVLVVEDEPPIMKNICRSIEKCHPDFQVAATAYDGREAQAVLESGDVPVDVMITDIHMPLMNGLELLEYVREGFPSVIPVVLSGYEDFSYAKTAFKSGVLDYLLKPVDRRQLKELLDKIAVQVREEQEKTIAWKLEKALAGTDGAETLVTDLKGDSLVLLLFCAGPFPLTAYDYLLPGREFWERHNLRSVLRRYLPGRDLWQFPGKSSAEQLIIIRGDSRAVSGIEQALLDYLKSLGSLPVSFCRAPARKEFSRLFEIHHNLRQSLHRNIKFAGSDIVPYTAYHTSPEEGPELRELKKKFCTAIGGGSTRDLGRVIMEDLAALIDMGALQQDIELYLTFCFQNLATSLSPGQSFNQEYSALRDIISGTWNKEVLVSETQELLGSLLRPRGDRDIEKEALVEKVKAYITLNYNRPFSNQTLSDKFGLGPSYLSSIFKAGAGLSPSDYLLDIRMEKARDLLTGRSNLLTRDVAGMVGYTDPLYFSRVFKKYFGVNPRAVKREG